MLYAILFNFLAGATTGSIYKIRALLPLTAFIFLEALLFGFTYGPISGLWTLSNLVTIEIGYMFGMYARGVIEHAHQSASNSHSPHAP